MNKNTFTTQEELEAAYFARAVVMPEDLFLRVVVQHTENGKTNINKIAEVFGINPLDVLARGKDLNIWWLGRYKKYGSKIASIPF